MTFAVGRVAGRTEVTDGSQRALVVDDEEIIRYVLSEDLREMGYECAEASCGEDALEQVANQKFELVVLDVRMPGMGGLEAMKMIRASSQETCVVMISGIENPDIAGRAMTGMGADAFVSKPWQRDELRATIHRAVRERSAIGSLNSGVPSMSTGD